MSGFKYGGTIPILPYNEDGTQHAFMIGDEGENVKQLQEMLNWLNTGTIVEPLLIDGELGPKTVDAMNFFKEVHHMRQNDKFGAKVLAFATDMTLTPQIKAINWAVSVAKDNSFAYGNDGTKKNQRAHHNGCYFCGTNVNGPKHAKKGSRWEKTYCCNPFIHAAYAHGAGDKKMLTACKNKSAAGMQVSDWTKFGFKKVGSCKKVKFKELKAGDVIINYNHVWMYTGDGYLVEAHGGTWSKDSIRHKKIAKKKYSKNKKQSSAYVMRYTK